jgi:hypothetical protein
MRLREAKEYTRAHRAERGPCGYDATTGEEMPPLAFIISINITAAFLSILQRKAA